MHSGGRAVHEASQRHSPGVNQSINHVLLNMVRIAGRVVERIDAFALRDPVIPQVLPLNCMMRLSSDGDWMLEYGCFHSTRKDDLSRQYNNGRNQAQRQA